MPWDLRELMRSSALPNLDLHLNLRFVGLIGLILFGASIGSVLHFDATVAQLMYTDPYGVHETLKILTQIGLAGPYYITCGLGLMWSVWQIRRHRWVRNKGTSQPQIEGRAAFDGHTRENERSMPNPHSNLNRSSTSPNPMPARQSDRSMQIPMLVPYIWLQRFAFGLVALITSGVLVQVCKFLIGRQRPFLTEGRDALIFNPFTHDWNFHSMPSGHAQVSFSVAAILSVWFPRQWWLWFCLAALVMSTRVFLCVHFVSDVLLGAVVGLVGVELGKLTWQRLWPWLKKRRLLRMPA
jgi:hypothetical protein